jgi:hypothetical protein
MRLLVMNGSLHTNGNASAVAARVLDTAAREGLESRLFQPGGEPSAG